MNKNQLFLLILEDNPDDAELVVKELKREGFIIEWSRVETEKTFREALAEKPDLIFVDYNLPSFDGITALKIQQKIVPEIPLIIISGTINDEIAVECMKSGATDYVLKDKLFRLSTVVNRALEEAEEHRAFKRAEEELRLFSQATNSSIDGIAMAELNGKITYINNSFIKMFGYSREELIGKKITFTFPVDQRQKIDKVIKTMIEDGWKGELIGRKKDSELFPLAVSLSRVLDEHGKVLALMAILRDITNLKILESQLFQAQKMEAIGTLAGGIAHDFNNLLTPILGFTNIVLSDLPTDSDAYEYLRQVLKAADRAKELVIQILSFSRKAEGKRKPINLAIIVKEALKLLRSSLPTTIEIRQNISPKLNSVNADSTQMHQVLMNLCTNAYHAMPEGGILEISLANIELDDNLCTEFNDLTAGSYVRLTVKDTGCGMDKGTLERIFEPFFTTKGQDMGTGMGLSVVYGIVKSHGGDITAHSEPGTGTTFQIYLPVSESIAEVQSGSTEPLRGGTESILFVDDEIAITKMGKKTLERLGYNVITQTSSVDALELFRFKSEEFDLVITDQTMPHKTGLDLASELILIRPDIPIILCTGYSFVITPDKAHESGIRKLVMKPIVGAELSRIVRRVLDESL